MLLGRIFHHQLLQTHRAVVGDVAPVGKYTSFLLHTLQAIFLIVIELVQILVIFEFAPGAHTPAEYGKYMIQESGGWTYPSAAVMAAFAKGITNKAELNGNSGGNEELSIRFETRMANQNIEIGNIVALPYNSFCDAKKYIDISDREMIEIENAKFERYGNYDIVTRPCVVIDGTKVFVPVAVGMNPRMNTVKLTLVSTNVQSSS